jgi:hypothetical protein
MRGKVVTILAPIFGRNPTMASEPRHGPSAIDLVTGHPIRFTEEERRAYHEGVQRALDEIETITDETDTDETWDEVFRGLAAARQGAPDAPGTP